MDVQLSASFQNMPGPQISANYTATNAVVAPSLGRSLSGGAANVMVNIVEPGTMYGERLNQLDLRIGKCWSSRNARQPQLDLYNALNANTVLTLNNNYASWLRPQTILTARFARVGAGRLLISG